MTDPSATTVANQFKAAQARWHQQREQLEACLKEANTASGPEPQ